jgi:formylmethanofuran dehydrogenase subunit E
MATEFHGYPAPGLLIGGYMVEAAKARLPKEILFEVLVETGKCLPDAVQLLTPCTVGNNWMRILDLGKYALSMYDKYTGIGIRVTVDTGKLKQWPEIGGWFFKLRTRAQQDSGRLVEEIEQAGDSILSLADVKIREGYLGRSSMKLIGVCPICQEAYPEADGAICKGCQGEAPYHIPTESERETPRLRSVPLRQAVGQKALHDMTEIVPGVSKGAAVAAGQKIVAGDVCRLQRMGRNHIYIDDNPGREWVHENEAVKAFAEKIAGPGVIYKLPPKEGKVEFTADRAGLLSIDVEKLVRFNLCPDVMLATRHDNSLVEGGHGVAGCRAIPLYISRELFSRAIAALGDESLVSILPMREAKAGILITGTEVFQGLIEDRFLPVVSAKLGRLDGTVIDSVVVPDDPEAIQEAVRKLMGQGIDLLITTGGMSVDPEDVTRSALLDLGMENALYGVPVLPGTMMLVGQLDGVQVLGIPACALYHKITGFDLLLPRLLAGKEITRKDLARLSEGGYCLGCQSCTFPKCPYGR